MIKKLRGVGIIRNFAENSILCFLMRGSDYVKMMIPAILAVLPLAAEAQEVTDSLHEDLQEVVVTQRRGLRKLNGATNTDLISASELKRAA